MKILWETLGNAQHIDLDDEDDEDDCPYCEIHKEEHELGGYICELTQGLRNMGWHRMSTWDGIE